MSRVGTPTVLDAPLDGIPLLIQIDARQHHSMGHAALAIVQASGFVEIELSTIDQRVVIDAQIQNTQIAIDHLANITAEPDGLAIDDHLSGGCLEGLALDI